MALKSLPTSPVLLFTVVHRLPLLWPAMHEGFPEHHVPVPGAPTQVLVTLEPFPAALSTNSHILVLVKTQIDDQLLWEACSDSQGLSSAVTSHHHYQSTYYLSCLPTSLYALLGNGWVFLIFLCTAASMVPGA